MGRWPPAADPYGPALAVLSAICHGDHPEIDAMFPALAGALRALGSEKEILYYDVVLAGLPEGARERWEAFMTAIALDYHFHSEALRTAEAHGEARGESRGEALAILTVLDARGVPVPAAIREQILACTDHDQLEGWLRRAAFATAATDVVSE